MKWLIELAERLGFNSDEFKQYQLDPEPHADAPRQESELMYKSGLFDGPLGDIPHSRRGVYEVFGNPGAGSVDSAWERRNMTLASFPELERKLYVHKLMEPYLREALRRCRFANVAGEIERIGCFNFRHQRHDPSRPLSYHAWGIAVDINPSKNRVVRFKAGEKPEPFSDEWRDIWPDGLSRELVEAFKSVGFSWGGDWKHFCDSHHFELKQ